MKIFSLETKKHLVGWSVMLSLMTNMIASILALRFLRNNIDSVFRCEPFKTNFVVVVIRPMKLILICANQNANFIFLILRNIFYWAVVAIIILSLIRYFRKYQVSK